MDKKGEKRINFVFLRGIVDNAIKNRDTSFIETIEDENQLIYMQKYIDLENTKRSFSVSFVSLYIGIIGFFVAGVAIGISFILTGLTSVPKSVDIIGGIVIFVLCAYYMLKTKKAFEKFETNKKDSEFWYDITLKIEERIIYSKGK